MVRVHLAELLAQRRWSQAALARKTHIRPNTINDLYHEMADRISFAQIDAICKALDCSVSELLEYISDVEQ